jgi:hypothetical protein
LIALQKVQSWIINPELRMKDTASWIWCTKKRKPTNQTNKQKKKMTVGKRKLSSFAMNSVIYFPRTIL